MADITVNGELNKLYLKRLGLYVRRRIARERKQYDLVERLTLEIEAITLKVAKVVSEIKIEEKNK